MRSQIKATLKKRSFQVPSLRRPLPGVLSAMTALVVRFRKPTDWADSVHIHYWNTRPHEQGSTWPGVPMEQVDGWLAHRFAGVAAASFVFNDCQSRQSGDLHRDRNGWYTEDGQWYNQPPQSAVAAPGRSSSRPEPQAIPQIKAEDTRLPDFHEETIYFLLTARFYDGDPSNNFFCRDRIRFDTAGKATDPHWRGDFKGLIQRLDYIRDLGFSAIWITPPIENRSGLDYHGYNRTRIDPRLESPDARYRDLIDAVHARSIKIIQDYVPHGSEPGRGGHGPLSRQPGQPRLAEPGQHRQPGHPGVVSGAPCQRPGRHRTPGLPQARL